MIFLSQTDFSILYAILLSWTGIFALFAFMSLLTARRGWIAKRKLQREGGYVFFPQVEIQRTARSFLGPNFSLSSKCEVAIGHHEIWFLPGKYSLTLFSNPIPNRVNLGSEKVSFHPEFKKSIIFRFTSEDMDSTWKIRWRMNIKYEVSLMFKDSEIREEVVRELEKQKSAPEI